MALCRGLFRILEENLSMRFLNLVTLAQLILICGLSKGMDIFILIVHFLNHNWELNHVTIGLLCLLLATPHNDGGWCSIEAFFSIFLCFKKFFHFLKKAFVIIALAF